MGPPPLGVFDTLPKLQNKLYRVDGWLYGWMVGESGNKANSAKLELKLG